MTFIAILIGLALLDGTAIATLFIPLWLLLAAGPFRFERVGIYLGSVIGFYVLCGLLLLAGADVVVDRVQAGFARGGALDTALVNGVIVAAGVGLVALSFRKPKPGAGPSRMTRWKQRALGVTTPRALATLAISVCALELWTMVPYLAAMTMIGALETGFAVKIGWLIAYCVMMVSPALVLVALRIALGERLHPALDWVDARMSEHGGSAVMWILALIGAAMIWFSGSRLLGW